MERRWRAGVSNPSVSVSIQEYSQEVVDQWIREIGDVARKLLINTQIIIIDIYNIYSNVIQSSELGRIIMMV